MAYWTASSERSQKKEEVSSVRFCLKLLYLVGFIMQLIEAGSMYPEYSGYTLLLRKEGTLLRVLYFAENLLVISSIRRKASFFL